MVVPLIALLFRMGLCTQKTGVVMPDPASVPRGPKPFEDLLKSVGLSEREADAVRTVVLDLTAAEAAPPYRCWRINRRQLSTTRLPEAWRCH